MKVTESRKQETGKMEEIIVSLMKKLFAQQTNRQFAISVEKYGQPSNNAVEAK